MKGILGKKIGMTQIFGEDGEILPVTIIQSGPCSVLQIKTKKSDGYNAIQVASEDKRFVKELPVPEPQDYKVGQNIDLADFSPGAFVDVVSTSKGRGFQGGIKRWHWKGGPKTHGSMSHRVPGSIGASAFPSRVLKGHHLPGQMGNRKVTIKNLEILKVEKDKSLLVVKGSVPGHKNCYVIIKESRKRPKPKVLKKTEAEGKKEKPEQKQQQKQKQK